MERIIALFIPILALSIPVIAITLGHRLKIRNIKLKEIELQKKILELEIVKQDGKIKLLEEENKNLDRKIGN